MKKSFVGMAMSISTFIGLATCTASAGAANEQPSVAPKTGTLIQVGPGRKIRTLYQASLLARDGDVLEVDAGEYPGDVVVWKGMRLTIRGVGGRARLIASGQAAEQKAIWVVRSGEITAEKIDFVGARVPAKNGAGIRFEGGRLTIRDCLFDDNENGILTGNDGQAQLRIENSEFSNNGAGDGQSHNLYVGSIAQLSVVGSYFHHARVGHLLKSRARENRIQYNRLTDELGGRASYEMEFPNGGLAIVVGNVVEQSSTTQNPVIVSFGAEGYRHPRNELYLVNNTISDNRPKGGIFLRVYTGAQRVAAINNLLVGRSAVEVPPGSDLRGNINVDWDQFVLAARHDYRLRPDATVIGKALPTGRVDGADLRPTHEYRHPRSRSELDGRMFSPGALQTPGPALR
jgi:hypothetical protein